MEQASEDFQALDDTRARTMQVGLSIYDIDSTLAYGREVIPARQSLQCRKHRTSLGQRGLRGAEQQHFRGILLDLCPRYHRSWRSWSTQSSSTPGELNQIWEPISGKHERSGLDQYRDTWWLTYHDTLGHHRVDAGEEFVEERGGLSLLPRGFSYTVNIVPDVLE
jgi:hypothetical protein